MDNQSIQPGVNPVVSSSPQVPAEPPTSDHPMVTKKGHLNSTTKFILFIVIVFLCTGGVYYWQHKKVANDDAKVSSLQSQISDSKNAVSTPSSTKSSTTSASQDVISSAMPQSQFSNPEFNSTLNYLSCLNNPGGSSKITGSGTHIVCSNGTQSYSEPTTMTYAMITNYSWLPKSADTTFINLTEQLFQSCSSAQGSGIGGANEVNYSNANFVIFTFGICGDSKTALYQDKNGTWTGIANAGVGGPPPSCSPYTTDNIPENVLQDNGICSDSSN